LGKKSQTLLIPIYSTTVLYDILILFHPHTGFLRITSTYLVVFTLKWYTCNQRQKVYLFRSTWKIALKPLQPTNKPPVAMKLPGGSYYGASLLWVSLFGSSQLCGWLTGKDRGPIKLQMQTPPSIFQQISPNSPGLLATQNNVS